ncbi:MAG: hypothetical protein ABIY90_14515 [Puia sp.]
MRKLLFIPLFSLFALATGNAQSYNSSLTFQKNQYPVAAIQIPFEEGVVKDGVKDFMSRKGFKDSRFKDFIIFRSVPLDGSGTLTDAYFSIDRKSRSEKDVTVINLLPVKKTQTLLPGNIEDSSFSGLAKSFLDSMKPFILHYSLQQQITAQQQVLTKVQSKFTRLKNDSGDIAKKIRGYEADLAENKNDQDKQQKEISITSTGDHAALAKAQSRMVKLLNKQSDIGKKLRNAREDADKNKKEIELQQDAVNKESQSLDSFKLRQKNLDAAS